MIEKVIAVARGNLHTAIYKRPLGLSVEYYKPLGMLGITDWEAKLQEDRENGSSGPSYITAVGYQGDGVYERVNAIYWGGAFLLADDIVVAQTSITFSLATIYIYDSDSGEYAAMQEFDDLQIDFGGAFKRIKEVIDTWASDFEFGLDDNDDEFFVLKNKNLLTQLSQTSEGIFSNEVGDYEDLEAVSAQWPLQIGF